MNDSRKPKNSSKDDNTVKERILDAAEKYFAEKGFDAATVREITTYANSNLAAVNYHFGSKKNLYIEMFRRHMTEMTGAQIENIKRVMNTENPTLEQLIRTLVTVALRPLKSNIGEKSFLKMMVREILHPHLGASIVTDESIGKFLTALRDAIIRLCPDIKPEAVMKCVFSIDALVLHPLLFSDYYYVQDPDLELDELIDHIVLFITSGIRAYTGGRT